jgi:hypothetical protein
MMLSSHYLQEVQKFQQCEASQTMLHEDMLYFQFGGDGMESTTNRPLLICCGWICASLNIFTLLIFACWFGPLHSPTQLHIPRNEYGRGMVVVKRTMKSKLIFWKPWIDLSCLVDIWVACDMWRHQYHCQSYCLP